MEDPSDVALVGALREVEHRRIERRAHESVIGLVEGLAKRR